MAQGDFKVFAESAREAVKSLVGNLGSDDMRLALISSATTPAVGDALPHFGGTGTTDLSTNELTGGEISAGGIVLTSEAITSSALGGFMDSADISIASNASNPSAVRWGILYNNTLATKRAIGFLDFGSDQDITTGLDITINASGWFTATVPA
jgi:hypothetical protein